MHKKSALITHAETSLINAHEYDPDVAIEARGLNIGQSLTLHPYFKNSSSEGSGKSAHMRRLA